MGGGPGVTDPRRPYARIQFCKRGPVRFVGHLDLARAFDRAVRRARLPVAYTQGFNPRARIAFGPPLPVGVESDAELCVLDLAQRAEPAWLEAALAAQLPPGLEIRQVTVGLRGRRSPLAALTRATYEIEVAAPPQVRPAVAEAVRKLLAAERVPVTLPGVGEAGSEQHDLRPGILALELLEGPGVALRLTVRIAGGGTARPAHVLAALADAAATAQPLEFGRMVRTELE